MFQSEVSFRNVIRGIAFLVLVLLAGTGWFALMEGYGFLESLYMTVITVSTVGFREVHRPDASGMIFTVVLIISGLTVLTYTLGAIGQVIVEGSIQQYVGRQKMQRDIDKMKDHYVICGHGRMGQILCEELNGENVPFVVVEAEPEGAERLREKHYKVVEGDATSDDILKMAGVDRAKGLVCVVSRNVDNLYITLSARKMCRSANPELYILSRATDQHAGEKITLAGADRVISPYAIGGMRIVQALLRPTVHDFLEVATHSRGLDLMFEELPIGLDSHLDGVAIRDSGIRKVYDVIVIGIKKPNGEMLFNPGPDTVLESHDVLITLGDMEQQERLRTSMA